MTSIKSNVRIFFCVAECLPLCGILKSEHAKDAISFWSMLDKNPKSSKISIAFRQKFAPVALRKVCLKLSFDATLSTFCFNFLFEQLTRLRLPVTIVYVSENFMWRSNFSQQISNSQQCRRFVVNQAC